VLPDVFKLALDGIHVSASTWTLTEWPTRIASTEGSNSPGMKLMLALTENCRRRSLGSVTTSGCRPRRSR
jgi:hypothetical protein